MANNRIDYSLTDYYNTNIGGLSNGGLAGYYSNGASNSNSMYQQQQQQIYPISSPSHNDQQTTQDSLLFQMFEDEMNMFNNYGFIHCNPHNHQDMTNYLNDFDRTLSHKIDSELNLFLGNLDWMSPLPTPPLSPLQTTMPTMQTTTMSSSTMPQMQMIPTMQTMPTSTTMHTMPVMPSMQTMPSMSQQNVPSNIQNLPSITTLPPMSNQMPSISQLSPSNAPTSPSIVHVHQQTSTTSPTGLNQRPLAKSTVVNNGIAKVQVKKSFYNSTVEPAKKQKQSKVQTKRTSCGTSLLATRPKLVKKQCKELIAATKSNTMITKPTITNHKLSNKSNTFNNNNTATILPNINQTYKTLTTNPTATPLSAMKSIQLPTVIIASNSMMNQSSTSTNKPQVSFTNPALREHDYCKML